MKKYDLKKLALLGITGAVAISSQNLQAGTDLAVVGGWGNRSSSGSSSGYQATSHYQTSDNANSNRYNRPLNENTYTAEETAPAPQTQGESHCGGTTGTGGKSHCGASNGTGGKTEGTETPQHKGNGGCGGKGGCGGEKGNGGKLNSSYRSSSSSRMHQTAMGETVAPAAPATAITTGAAAAQDATNQTPDERQFVSQLNEEGKAIWTSLDKDGRQLALRLSKQYANKNQAVKEAQKQRAQTQQPVQSSRSSQGRTQNVYR